MIAAPAAAAHAAPDRVPARLMIARLHRAVGAVRAGPARSVSPGATAPTTAWVNLDLSIWFLLNFCMLMLTSFRAGRIAAPERAVRSAHRRAQPPRPGQRTAARSVEARRPRHGLAVIALDLDHFKAVNDDHGHEAGDLVLQRFSDTVRGCIRGDDLFARIGGEEFVVVLPDSTAEQRAAPGRTHPRRGGGAGIRRARSSGKCR